ncbi:MAG: PQQ-dependent sugar dehydrogenase [Actinomycetia bacterium]|nr:PQQ-dependent sugar dehydrogenase [Actinomycetes bacterium]
MSRSRKVAIAAVLVFGAGCAADGNTSDTTLAPVATVATTVAGSDTTPANTATTAAPEPTTPEVTVPLEAGSIVLTPYVDGFQAPVDLAWRNGDSAIYVVDQEGLVIPVVNGVSGAPVLDITGLVSCCGEQGLLGLAFHPTDPLAYVDYTNTDGNTVVAEFAIAADGTFEPDSRRTVITIDQPYPNHNGGDVAFGPDGLLYIGMGDGGSGGDPERRALALGEPLGKLLRIDPRASGDQPYTIPADNPFVDVDGATPEIWSIGLRNPWRFNFDSATGDLWIGDVGQGEWEEVDVARASDGGGRGVNFGWSALEGTHPYNGDQSTDGVTMPIHEYQHGDSGCSISGGTVYRGDAIPSLRGWYLFGDYCSGKVWALSAEPGAAPVVLELANAGSVSAIAAGPDGELYVLAYGTGSVLRIDPA